MRSRFPWTPLLLALLVLGGGALLAGLFVDHVKSDDDWDAAGREERRDEDGALLTGPGMSLDGSRAPRPRTPGQPAPEDVAGGKPPSFPPSEGVAGRVVTAGRAPIAGAKVTLHLVPSGAPWGAPDPPALAESVTAQDGAFLVGPAPLDRLRVRAVAKGYAPSVLPVARRGAQVEIVLDVGGGLRVKAVDGEGRPVVGAAVIHTAGGWGTQVVSEAVTGADGAAVFESLPTGSGGLLVCKPGLGAARRGEVGVTPGGMADVVLVLQGGRELGGTITNALDKRPVAGASVEVHYPWIPGLQPGAPVVSDEDGRYRATVDVAVGEQFELRVASPGFAELRQWLNYNDGGSGAMTHDLVLDQAVPGISGRVLSPEGGGVAGAEISFGNQQPGQSFPAARSGTDGRFDLPSPAWGGPGSQWWIVALHPTEGVGSAHATLPQRNAPRGKEVTLTLSGAGHLLGMVKDGAGAPVAGAAVTLAPDWGALERRTTRSGRPVDWLIYQLLNDARVAGRLAAVTDPEGRFEIPDVPAATFTVTALWGPLQGLAEAPIEVKPGQEARAEIVLGEGQAIEGVVIDGQERPVAGATVWSQPQNPRPGAPGSSANARSQSDGRFRLVGVAAGTHQLFAQAAGFAQGQLAGVSPGTRDAVMRLKAMGWIEGQVLLDNVPYAGTFHVTAARRSEAPPDGGNLRRIDGGDTAQTFNDAEGRFVLQGLSGGEHRLTARTDGGLVVLEELVVSVVEGQAAGPVRIALEAGASLVGEVEGADGRPLPGCWIWAAPVTSDDGRGPGAGARSDKQGAFRVRGLGSGPYRVTVNTEQGVHWAEPIELARGAEQRLRLRERLPGRVAFTVLGPDDRPLAAARPTLHDGAGVEAHPNWQLLRRDGLIDGRSEESWKRATTTDEAGRLVRHHVPPGRYRASAAFEGHEPDGEAWIDVAAGAVTEVTVRLKRTP